MTFRETLISKIEETLPDVRVYAYPAPDSANIPYIILSRESESAEKNMDGTTAFHRDNWMFSLFGNTESECEKIRLRILDVFGMVYCGLWGDFAMILFKHTQTTDLVQSDSDDQDQKIVRYDLTFMAKYKPINLSGD